MRHDDACLRKLSQHSIPESVLKEEFLEPLHVMFPSPCTGAGICHTAVADIIQDRGRITADRASTREVLRDDASILDGAAG